VAHHVEDDAAAVLGAVVPRRPLARLQISFEHPVAELASDRQDAPEEAGVHEQLELAQPRKEQLVLHDAVAKARRLGLAHEGERVREARSDRLLAIDVLARIDRLGEK
jgi:hypothetical protein